MVKYLGVTEHSKNQDLEVNLDNYFSWLTFKRGFPGSSDGKESAYKAGDLGLIPGSGRSPGEGNGYPLQYSCLENFIDR